MAMATVCTGDLVAIVKVHAKACGNGLLSRIKMDKAGNLAGSEFEVDPLLKLPNHPHCPVSFE